MQNDTLGLLIVGTGGHAQALASWLLAEGHHPVAGFVAANETEAEEAKAHVAPLAPVLGWDATLHNLHAQGYTQLVVGVGDNHLRQTLQEQAQAMGFVCPALTSQRAWVAPLVGLGSGSVVFPFGVIGVGCTVGEGCIVNTHAVLEHHSQLGAFSHLATGATTGGHVTIGTLSLIGVGACIAPQMTVAAQALVGAGAVVVKHVAAHTTVVGNPARFIKANAR